MIIVGVEKKIVSIINCVFLENVLHFQKLCVSLVSVHELAKIPERSLIFYGDDSSFFIKEVSQDKTSLAKIHKGLYYLLEGEHETSMSMV